MRLISIEKREKLRCYNCGKSPVKYYITDVNDFFERERPYCNKCALIISFKKRDSDIFLRDED